MSISGLSNTFSNPNPNPKFLNPTTTSTPNSIANCKFNFRVYAKVVTPQPNGKVYDQLAAISATTNEKRKKKDDEDKEDYYLNIGYAIRCLRDEFPHLFSRELTFDIYRDDIVFKDPMNTFAGIENYKSIFRALRFYGRIFFKALSVEILSVWQTAENIILIRWTVHGIPRVPWDSRGRFDGISEYKLDRKGKIYEHKVDNIALNSLGKFHVRSVQELILSLGCPSTPKPTYFEFSSISANIDPLILLMKSANNHLDSALELSYTHEAETSQRS